MRNLFTLAGALAALAILMAAPFAALASAEGTVMGARVPSLDKSLAFGEPYDSGNILDHAPATYRPAGSMYDYPMSHFGYMGAMQEIMPNGAGSTYPDWLTVSLGTSDAPSIRMTGTPTASGTYEIILAGGARDPMKPSDPPTFETEIARWTITVAEPIPPTPYTITLITDPVAEPTSISTSAGSVTLTNGAGTVLEGTVMHEPQLSRDRYIVHRWTDAQGNTYDWSKPVAKDLTLTADWREHFSATVEGNRATVTISADLPSQYNIHQIDWGDNTRNSDLTHLYAMAGQYTITVRSGQFVDERSSSMTVTVETMTVVTYTVTFNPAGGSIVPSQTVESGKTATEPQAPTRDGYTFQGWLKDNKPYDFSQPVTGNLYLSASWTPVPPSDDQDDEEQSNGLLLILLTALTIISLLITLLTRSPYAFGLTIVLALIELALLMLGLGGVIA